MNRSVYDFRSLLIIDNSLLHPYIVLRGILVSMDDLGGVAYCSFCLRPWPSTYHPSVSSIGLYLLASFTSSSSSLADVKLCAYLAHPARWQGAKCVPFCWLLCRLVAPVYDD
eukprot:TRINITY_DN6943_c0_g1_i7.p1 TRINITY_DN6943_c0_g1~~TRINITY_DN6943_c0_g1_i7.p1  ORF type:complete len:112 (+),score=3.31 TRINITY_DN6943_c0_g1_i7:112-447(+)